MVFPTKSRLAVAISPPDNYYETKELTAMVQIKFLREKRQRTRSMMKEVLPAMLVIALGLPAEVSGQTEAFTRQETCPNDNSLTGYTSIQNLNEDMAAELQRIEQGGEIPDGGYDLILCPGGTFDATGDSIQPVLDQVSISCGGPNSVDPLCVIDGGEEQLLIQDSSVNGYTLTSVTINGLIFSNFGGETSASLTASRPTEFTCVDCIWQDFDGAENVAVVDGSMTMRIVDGTIRTSEENTVNANVNQAVFNVRSRGNLEVEGLVVRDITTTQDIIRVSGIGSSAIVSDATVSMSSIQRNVGRAEEGANIVLRNVTVRENDEVDTAFFARGPGTTLDFLDGVITNHDIPGGFSFIAGSQGAAVNVLDSSFFDNNGVRFGVVSQGPLGGAGVASNVTVERSSFVNNVAFVDPELGPTTVAGTIGTSIGDPILNLKRIDFEGNNGFVGVVLTLNGGDIEISQACWSGGSNTLVAFQGKGGQPIVAADNFIADDEASSGCPNDRSRIGIEQEDSDGCFTSGTVRCRVSCGGPLANSNVCLSQVELSEAPSAVPSAGPSASLSPSESPSGSDSPNDAPTTLASANPTDVPTTLVTVDLTNIPTALPSLSQAPTSTQQPTGPSLGPTEVEITATPTLFPTIGFLPTLPPVDRPQPTLPPINRPLLTPPPVADRPQPTKPPVHRPDCGGKGKGKGGGGKGYCPKKKSKKSTKKSDKRSKLSKKSSKDLKRSKNSHSSKDSKKINMSSKSNKNGKGKGKGYSWSHPNPNPMPHPVVGHAASSTSWNALGGAQGVYRTNHASGNSSGRRDLAEDEEDVDEGDHVQDDVDEEDEDDDEEEENEDEEAFEGHNFEEEEEELQEEDEEETIKVSTEHSNDDDDDDGSNNDDGDKKDTFVFQTQPWKMPQDLEPILIDETFRI